MGQLRTGSNWGGHHLYNVRSSIGTGSLLSYPGPRSSGGARGQNYIFRNSVVVETANSAALSNYGVNATGIAEIVVIFRNDSSLAEMPGSFA